MDHRIYAALFCVLFSVSGLISGCNSAAKMTDVEQGELAFFKWKYFDPGYVEQIKDLQVQIEEGLAFWGGYPLAGLYNPVFERVTLRRGLHTDPQIVVHEILHHTWFTYPGLDKVLFMQDLERFLKEHTDWFLFHDLAEEWGKKYESKWFPVLKGTELYSMIGDRLVIGRGRGYVQPLPDYMLRHYRGVLHKQLLMNNSQVKGYRLEWWSLSFTLKQGGARWYTENVSWNQFAYFQKFGGGVYAKEVTSSNRTRNCLLTELFEKSAAIRLPPGSMVNQVRVKLSRGHSLELYNFYSKQGGKKKFLFQKQVGPELNISFTIPELMLVRELFEEESLKIEKASAR